MIDQAEIELRTILAIPIALMGNVSKRFDLSFFLDLVPVLPDTLLPQAVSVITRINVIEDDVLYTRILETLAARLPVKGIESLLQDAIWEHPTLVLYLPEALIPKALIAIQGITDKSHKSPALATITVRLPEAIRSSILRNVLAEMRATEDEWERILIMEAFASYLPKRLLQETLAIARSFSTDWDRMRALKALSPHLPKALLPETLMAARIITDESDRISALTALLPRLSPAMKGGVLQEILTTARAMQDTSVKAKTLTNLLPNLPKALLPETLMAARIITDESDRISALTALLPRLSPAMKGGVLQEILATARAIQDTSVRAKTLTYLLPILPKPMKNQVLREALTAAHTIDDEGARAAVLITLSNRLSGDSRQKVLIAALVAARAIDEHRQRASTLTDLIPHLPETLKENATQEALAAVQALNEWEQEYLLKALSPYLSEPMQAGILENIQTVGDEENQARIILVLAPYLSEALLEIVLAKIQAMKNEVARGWALAELAPYLSEPLRALALVIAQTLEDTSLQAQAVADLMPRPSSVNNVSAEYVRQLLNQLQEDRQYSLLEEVLQAIWLSRRTGRGGGGPPRRIYLPSSPDWAAGLQVLPSIPLQERIVSTGFATESLPDAALDTTVPLSCNQDYYFWLEVGASVAGSMEMTSTTLPVEHLPSQARLSVALFSFDDEIQITLGSDIGEIQLQSNGAVVVVRQPDSLESITVDFDLLTRRLFFPVHTPNEAGIFRLDCHIYYEQVLIQSRQIRVQVMVEPVRSSSGRAFYSVVDYTLVRILDPAQLVAIPSHRASLILKSAENRTHSFHIFGTDGAELVKGDASFDGLKLKDLIQQARGALRLAAWGDEQPWNKDKVYRYTGSLDLSRLKIDLVRSAIRGYRFYFQIISNLTDNLEQRKKLTELIRKPGEVQIALENSASHILPAALIYDYPLDTNAYPNDLNSYVLCSEFVKALSSATPLEEISCFNGACPSRNEDTTVCPSGFWGYRHSLGMPLSVGNGPDISTEIIFQQDIQLTIGVSTDPTFTERATHEKVLKTLRPEWNISNQLTTAWHYADTRNKVFKFLKETNPHLVYFYCHGGVHNNNPYIEVGYEDDVITPDNLLDKEIYWSDRHPLVFINGCQTTALEPEIALEFVSSFIKIAHASGVIGTEITIFEPLARTFAEKCLGYFLTGMSIGEAIRRTRLSLLKAGNPLGLVYIPFTIGSLRLVEHPLG